MYRIVSACLASLVLLTGCAYDPTHHSTEGVSVVDEDAGRAMIPTGETLVLKKTYKCGKSRCSDYWRIANQGEGDVTVTDDELFGDRVREYSLLLDEKTEIDTGWGNKSLYVTVDVEGTVELKWPSGLFSSWRYREYVAPPS